MTTQDSCDLQTIMNKTGNTEHSQLASVMMIMKKMGSEMGEDLGDDFDQALEQELSGGGLDDGFAGDDD